MKWCTNKFRSPENPVRSDGTGIKKACRKPAGWNSWKREPRRPGRRRPYAPFSKSMLSHLSSNEAPVDSMPARKIGRATIFW